MYLFADLSILDFDTAAIRHGVRSMSINEALGKLGNVIPEDIKNVLLEGSLSRKPTHDYDKKVEDIVGVLNDLYLSTFKKLGTRTFHQYSIDSIRLKNHIN